MRKIIVPFQSRQIFDASRGLTNAGRADHLNNMILAKERAIMMIEANFKFFQEKIEEKKKNP